MGRQKLIRIRVLIDSFRSRHDLVLENLVLRQQLDVLQRTKPKPRLRTADRVPWVWLRRIWPSGWACQLRIVRPETVIGWHRQGWRLLDMEVTDSARSASSTHRGSEIDRSNDAGEPLWGTEHIRGELLKLAIVVSNRRYAAIDGAVRGGREVRAGEHFCATRSKASGRQPLRGPNHRLSDSCSSSC